MASTGAAAPGGRYRIARRHGAPLRRIAAAGGGRLRIFLTGHRGQLGRALQRAAGAAGWSVTGVDLPEVDVADAAAIVAAARACAPQVIVNCAAFTAVDAAETREAEAFRVNARAVEHLARAAKELGALLVQISTDYVFDGRLSRPYREEDEPRPASVYGRSKLEGERAAALAPRRLVVRTAWLFGHGGRNFVEAIRAQITSGARTLRVVHDQVGSPSYAEDVAYALVRLLEVGAEGVVHVVNEGRATWYEVAREIVVQLGVAVEVVPIATAESRRPAPRPAYSVLDTSRLQGLLGEPLPPWQDALRRYLAAEGSRR